MHAYVPFPSHIAQYIIDAMKLYHEQNKFPDVNDFNEQINLVDCLECSLYIGFDDYLKYLGPTIAQNLTSIPDETIRKFPTFLIKLVVDLIPISLFDPDFIISHFGFIYLEKRIQHSFYPRTDIPPFRVMTQYFESCQSDEENENRNSNDHNDEIHNTFLDNRKIINQDEDDDGFHNDQREINKTTFTEYKKHQVANTLMTYNYRQFSSSLFILSNCTSIEIKSHEALEWFRPIISSFEILKELIISNIMQIPNTDNISDFLLPTLVRFEIFKTKLDSRHLKEIIEFANGNKNLRTLCLSETKMGSVGCSLFVEAIEMGKLSNLENLDISSNEAGGTATMELLRAIMKSRPDLVQIQDEREAKRRLELMAPKSKNARSKCKLNQQEEDDIQLDPSQTTIRLKLPSRSQPVVQQHSGLISAHLMKFQQQTEKPLAQPQTATQQQNLSPQIMQPLQQANSMSQIQQISQPRMMSQQQNPSPQIMLTLPQQANSMNQLQQIPQPRMVNQQQLNQTMQQPNLMNQNQQIMQPPLLQDDAKPQNQPQLVTQLPNPTQQIEQHPQQPNLMPPLQLLLKQLQVQQQLNLQTQNQSLTKPVTLTQQQQSLQVRQSLLQQLFQQQQLQTLQPNQILIQQTPQAQQKPNQKTKPKQKPQQEQQGPKQKSQQEQKKEEDPSHSSLAPPPPPTPPPQVRPIPPPPYHLSLSGLSIDANFFWPTPDSISKLVEIPLRAVSLRGIQWDWESATLIKKALEVNKEVKFWDLSAQVVHKNSDPDLSPEIAQEVLKNASDSIEALFFSNHSIQHINLSCIVHLQNLRALSLTNSKLMDDSIDAIEPLLSHLSYLDLSDNLINFRSNNGSFLRSCVKSPTLKYLILSGNNISDKGGKIIFDTMKELGGKTAISTLKLRNCFLRHKSSAALLDFLATGDANFVELDIGSNDMFHKVHNFQIENQNDDDKDDNIINNHDDTDSDDIIVNDDDDDVFNINFETSPIDVIQNDDDEQKELEKLGIKKSKIETFVVGANIVNRNAFTQVFDVVKGLKFLNLDEIATNCILGASKKMRGIIGLSICFARIQSARDLITILQDTEAQNLWVYNSISQRVLDGIMENYLMVPKLMSIHVGHDLAEKKPKNPPIPVFIEESRL